MKQGRAGHRTEKDECVFAPKIRLRTHADSQQDALKWRRGYAALAKTVYEPEDKREKEGKEEEGRVEKANSP